MIKEVALSWAMGPARVECARFTWCAIMKNFSHYLGLAAKLLVFLLVLGFALKNGHPVIFYSYLGYAWQAPLIVMLGLAFVLGAMMGVLALLPTLFQLRRESAKKPQTTMAEPITEIESV
jgi:putative membrane protein